MSAWQRSAMRCVVLVALLPMVLGCAAPMVVSPSIQAASPTAGDTPAPVDSAESAPGYDPTGITQICESWGRQRAERTITCGKGIKTALDSLGPDAATVERIHLRYTPPCFGAAGCPPRSEDHAWAAIRSRRAADELVELSIRTAGEIIASQPRPDPAPPTSPAFASPPVDLPLVTGPVPDEVRDRQPLPLCGIETAGMGGPYDTAARRCFLNRALAGKPVEFVTQGPGTEGENALTIYRFAGSGAIRRYDREAGAWSWTACGLTILRTNVVFATDGVCRRGDLGLGR
jgi:hypothetical protein